MVIAILAAAIIQLPPPNHLSLSEAIRHGIAARGRVREARAGLAEARAGRRLAGQVPNPTLSYDYTGDFPRQHLLFDQPLAWLTTRGLERGAAAATIRKAQADSMVAVSAVVQEVRAAYYGALGARESLRLVGEQVAAADSLAGLARRRLEVGDISRFEYEQTAQEARRGEQLLSSAREEVRAADAEFIRALGWADPMPPVAEGALDQDLDMALVSEYSPDSLPVIVSAVADSAAQALTYRSIQRARIPIPSVSAGADWDDPERPGERLSVIGFSVPLPIWNSGGAEAAQAQARAGRAAALAHEARIEGVRAVTEARARLEESARRARFARDSLLPAARALREQALAAYRAGETSLLAVLDAFRSEREVVIAQIQDFIAFQAALSAWRALFGRIE
ncbi:MAG TPA: TolC family protein [Gemmatimonadales bacterium]|nr:TolC family protein [Gemmatimonadales bacterium]